MALAVLVALTALLPGAARARDAYTAPPVQVDATANSPAQAKEMAIVEGQTKALRALLESLTSPADHGRLPQVSAAEAQDMVTDFGFSGERTAAKRYLATMTVSFNAEGVDRLLASAGLGHITPREAPVLIIPVYRDSADATPLLWEETNPWAQAWDGVRDLSSGLVPIVLPLGDLEDIATLDAQGALSGQPGAVAGMGGRYGAPDVLVVEAVGTQETGLVLVPRGAGVFGGMAPVNVAGGKDAFDRGIAALRLALDAAWKNQALGGGGGVNGAYDSDPMAAFGGVNSATQGTAPGWGYGERPVGAGQGAYYGGAQGLILLARFGSLAEWVDMRRKLQAIPGLQGMNLQAVTSSQAQVELAYQGAIDDLQRIMAGRGLRMTNAGTFWTLERVAGAPANGIPGMGATDAQGFPTDPAHRRIQGVN
jgi:hypothetical protein